MATTLQQIKERKAIAIGGIQAANAKVWEMKNKVMTEKDAQEVTNYLDATFNAIEQLTAGIKY